MSVSRDRWPLERRLRAKTSSSAAKRSNGTGVSPGQRQVLESERFRIDLLLQNVANATDGCVTLVSRVRERLRMNYPERTPRPILAPLAPPLGRASKLEAASILS